MSRVPWKVAESREGEQVRWETLLPPRTRSSVAVQSSGDQGWLAGEACELFPCLLRDLG